MTATRLRIGVGALSLSLVLALLLGATGVLAPRGSVAFGASTTLAILGGEVLVSQGGGPFEPAQDGAILGPGDAVRTGDDAHAVLTYFEGSTVSLEPGTELRIDEASAQPDGGTVVAMTQNLGRTWHVVTRLVSGNSKYEVRTPASTASVRGTTFEVGLDVDAQTGEVVATVSATEGAVATAPAAAPQAPAPEPVIVQAGFETSVRRSAPRADPPRPKAEPERTVTVAVPTNALVIDAQGRANGVTKDGRVVVQTPNARVIKNADGTYTVILADPRDGVIATVIETPATPQAARLPEEVRVVTTVTERGKPPVTVEEKVDTRRPEATKIVTGVEVKRGTPDRAPELRQLKDDEKKELKTDKVAEPPKPESRPARPGVGGFGRATPNTLRESARPTERGQKTVEPTDRRTSEPTRPPSDPGRGGPGGAGSTGGQGGGTGQGAGAGGQGEGRPGAPANPPAIIPVLPLQPFPGQPRTSPPRTPIPAPTEKKDDEKKTAEPARGAPVSPPARPAVSSPTSAPANAPVRAPANAPGIVPGLPLQPPPAPGQPAPAAPPQREVAPPRREVAPPPADRRDDVRRGDDDDGRRRAPIRGR